MDTVDEQYSYSFRSEHLTPLARSLPGVAVAAGGLAIAWFDHGSVAPAQFLPWALLAALLVAVAASAGAAGPPRVVLVAAGALVLLAAWVATSAGWAPIPSHARDQALLISFGALALVVPAITLRSAVDRILSTEALTALIGLMAVATLYHLRTSFAVEVDFIDRRLSYPIAYSNAQAALLALGLWPAIVLGSRRAAPVAVRAAAFGIASTCAAEILMAQSKGAVLGAVVSLVAMLAISAARLRLLVGVVVAFFPVAAAAAPLTSPFRTETMAERATAVQHAALVAAMVGVAGLALGLLFAVIDARTTLRAERRRWITNATRFAALLAALAAVAGLVVSVPHPGRVMESKWRAFKHSPGRDTSSTHLFTFGSNRYDFWVVAIHEWTAHPVAGAGSGAFAVDYLQHGTSYETPARPHSLPLELLGETGVVGFALGALALGAVLVGLGRAARRNRAPAVAAFAAAAGFIAHACVDWTWTFPAVTVPLFVLCGIALAGDGGRDLTRRASVALAAGAVAVAILWLAPPWLAARLLDRGSATRSTSDLRWAHRLDPVSTAPWIAQARVAATPEAALPPLERAVHREPRSLADRFILGSTLYNAGRLAAARHEFEAALALHPGDPAVTRALAIVRAAHRSGSKTSQTRFSKRAGIDPSSPANARS